jgi:hypothetical protein
MSFLGLVESKKDYEAEQSEKQMCDCVCAVLCRGDA